MTISTQITFRGIAPFDHARDIVHARLMRMTPLLTRGTRCEVLLERVVDSQHIGSRRVYAHVRLLGTGMQVTTLAREDASADALRMALARAEERLLRQRGARLSLTTAMHAP
ncbi:MAG: hypothetical protein ABW252_18280 [Polyangiales bacterium]